MAYNQNFYNPFLPVNNQNFTGYQPNGYVQNQGNLAAASVPNSSTAGSIMTIFVNSEDEANNYPVAAGLTVLLISFNLNKFWLKSTDTSGVPQQPRSFSFNEETPLQTQTGSFVSRAEFADLSTKLDKLISELGGTKND